MTDRVAIYPGSFDPLTEGHADVVRRSLRLFDRVIVAVLDNASKQGTFTPDERVGLIRAVFADEPRVEVEAFAGLLVDYVARKGARVVVRGLRAVQDFEYEFQMTMMNRRLAPDVETLFLMTDQAHFYVASRTVKEIARFGGDIEGLVPAVVADAIHARLGAPRRPEDR